MSKAINRGKKKKSICIRKLQEKLGKPVTCPCPACKKKKRKEER